MRASLVEQSPWYKLLIVFLLAVGGTFLFLFIGILLVPVFFNVEISDLMVLINNPSSPESTELFKFLQGFNTIGTFLAPALLAAYLFSKFPSDYLQINEFPGRGLVVSGLVIIIAISGISIADVLYRVSTQIPFPEFLGGLKESIDATQGMMEEQISSFLKMETPLEFMQVFVILALLPAVCEETLFRGIIQPLFIRGFNNPHLGIIMTSIIFGLLHQQFYSFLSIMALSIALGYLKQWSNSLWVPVLMHLVNNGSIVVAVYFFNMPTEDLQSTGSDFDVLQFLLGAGIFIISMIILYILLKRQKPEDSKGFSY